MLRRLLGPAPWKQMEWVLWMAGRWQVLKPEQRESTSPVRRRSGRARRLVLLMRRPSRTHAPCGLVAVDGGPVEQRAGNQNSRRAAAVAHAYATVPGSIPQRMPPSNLRSLRRPRGVGGRTPRGTR